MPETLHLFFRQIETRAAQIREEFLLGFLIDAFRQAALQRSPRAAERREQLFIDRGQLGRERRTGVGHCVADTKIPQPLLAGRRDSPVPSNRLVAGRSAQDAQDDPEIPGVARQRTRHLKIEGRERWFAIPRARLMSSQAHQVDGGLGTINAA